MKFQRIGCVRYVAHKKISALLIFLVFGLIFLEIARLFGSHWSTRNLDNSLHCVPKEKRFVTVYCLLEHGLGNNLFQVASAYGIARHTNRTLLLAQSCAALKYFDMNSSSEVIDMEKMHYTTISSDWYILAEFKANMFDSVLFNHSAWNCATNIKLIGYLQSWKYFSNVMNEVKKLFSFHRTLSDGAYKFLFQAVILFEQKTEYDQHYHQTKDENIRYNSSQLVFVGIHIRRGDMLSASKQSYGYVTADEAYIMRSMLYFDQKFRFVIFVVCSDDLIWSRENIKPLSYRRNLVVYCPGISAAEDLAILSLCNHTIITVGTFGWWAGLLAGGTVIYYKNFPRSGSMLDHSFSTKKDDYYYLHWIPL